MAQFNEKISNPKSSLQVVHQASELDRVRYNVPTSSGRPTVDVPGLGLIDDFMASDDLNECVSALLKKRSKAALQQFVAAIESDQRFADESLAQKVASAQNAVHRFDSFQVEPQLGDAKGMSPDQKNLEMLSKYKAMTSTNESSPQSASGADQDAAKRESAKIQQQQAPRVVIRRRVKNIDRVNKRFRKNGQQN